MIIGEERAVGELWRRGGPRMPEPREDRPGPAGLRDRRAAGSRARPACGAATLDDLERLIPVCAAAHEDELGVDPLARDAEGFRWRTRAQIDEGRSWLWLEDDVILFKAEASAWTPTAVQVQQVWVDPAARGRGYGARGMRDLCRLLLAMTPIVTLFVRTENAAGDRALRVDRHAPASAATARSSSARRGRETAILARHGESEFSVRGAPERRHRRSPAG